MAVCSQMFFVSKWQYFRNFAERKDFFGQEQVQLTMRMPEEKVRLANIMKPKFHFNGVHAVL